MEMSSLYVRHYWAHFDMLACHSRSRCTRELGDPSLFLSSTGSSQSISDGICICSILRMVAEVLTEQAQMIRYGPSCEYLDWIFLPGRW